MEKGRMIDSHCHLEQPQYSKDLDKVIERCKKAGLRAVITSCARPSDFERTMEIADKYRNYVFPCIGMHPEFIKELKDREKDVLMEKIRGSRRKIVAIGEIGLDYHWIKEEKWQEKQKELFREMILLAKDLKKPIVLHSRNSHGESLKILMEEGAKNVQLHMWGGHQKELMEQAIHAGFYVSFNTIVLRSKTYRKVLRDTPLEKIMLETDSPWLGVKRFDDGWSLDPDIRNEPPSIRITAEKIAELKKLDFEELWQSCGKNAIRFFGLPL